jgi:hypothetical protein
MLPSFVIFKNGPRLCQSPARLGPTNENVGDVGGGSGGDVRQGEWFNNGLWLPVGVEGGRERRRYVWYDVVVYFKEMEKIQESNSYSYLLCMKSNKR